MTNIVSYL